MSPAVKNIILRSSILTPDRLPGLAAWYSADYGVLTSISPDVAATEGQTVRRLVGRAGTVNTNADQAILAQQPVYLATGGIGGGPCISFDGEDDVLVAAGFLSTIVPTAAFWAVWVGIIDSATTEFCFAWNGAGNGGFGLQNTIANVWFASHVGDSNYASLTNAATSTAAFVRYDGNGAGATLSVNNGTLATKSAYVTNFTAYDTLCLGAARTTGAVGKITKLSEFICGTGTLDAATLAKLFSYLRRRYPSLSIA